MNTLPISLRRFAAGAILLLTACSPALQSPGPATARIDRGSLESCSLAGVTAAARCGRFQVPENRADATGRAIDLNFAIIPASQAGSLDPVVLLAGGPGQAATELGGFLDQLHQMNPDRDLLLLDQRGTGASNPLTCGSGNWLRDATENRDFLADPTATRDCLEQLAPKADVRFYGTPPAVEDLEALRGALGYRQLNLVGISYGTRMGQAFLRKYPESVRTMVLRAVAPMDFNLPVDGSIAAQAALDRVVSDCEADAACSSAFPNFEAELDGLFARFAANPEPIRLSDPATGDTATVLMTRDRWASVMNVLLLGPTTRSIPLLVQRATTQGIQSLAPIVTQVFSAVYGPLPVGMYLAITCAEDEPRITAEDVRRTQDGFLGPMQVVSDTCAPWPRGELPENYHEPVRSGVPVLIISGEYDSATPVEMGDRVARHLSNSRHLVVPATSHGPPFPGCVQSLVSSFVREASVEGLDFTCVNDIRWNFAVPAAR